MVEFRIENNNNKDVLSYIDYKTDGSKVSGQVENPNTKDPLDPELFLQLFKNKDVSHSYERSSRYDDSAQRLYTFNPNLESSNNAVKVSVDKNSSNYDRYCEQFDDLSYEVNLENSKCAKDNHLKNFKSFVAFAAAAGIAISALGFSTLVASHGYDTEETINDIKSAAVEINSDIKTSDEVLNEMVDDGETYHAARR